MSDVGNIEVSRMKAAKHARSNAKQRRGESGGCSCLAFARAGLRVLYIESKVRGDNLSYAGNEQVGMK